MQLAGIPLHLAYADGAGDYLAAMFRARRNNEKLTVKDAAAMAGLTPSAIRERRRTDPVFRAAERTCRFGEPYAVVHEPEGTEPEPEPVPEPRSLDEWLERQGVFR
jgi:hypothetical protein